MGISTNPIRFFNGEVVHTRADVWSDGFGFTWGHVRCYSNQQPYTGNTSINNGWNWNVVTLPYIGGATLAGSTVAVYGNLYDIQFFVSAGLGVYDPQYGVLSTLVTESSGSSSSSSSSGSSNLILTEKDGTVSVFLSLDDPVRPGGFLSRTSPGGTTIAVTSVSGFNVQEVQRSAVIDGVTVTEAVVYEFVSQFGIDYIQSCTLQRQTGADAPWENILQAQYTYYDGTTVNGGPGDLCTVTRSVWDATSSAWLATGKEYYRYYIGGPANMKFFCGPQAYANLLANGINPLTATDTEISLYADNFFVYEGSQRVSLESVDAGSKTMTYAHTINPHFTDGSYHPPGINDWYYKTVETRPDDSEVITYSNFAGQTMLSVLSGGGTWCTFFEYNGDGQVVLIAHPSAVLGYDESYDSLLNKLGDLYEYLRDSSGKIELFEYYWNGSSSSSSSHSSGAHVQPNGYLQAVLLQNGQTSTPILIRSYDYDTATAPGITIYPVATEFLYPDATDSTVTIQTNYAYTYYSGTVQLKQKTITLPVISTAQNGSGTANQRLEYYDIHGNLTWAMDERMFITNFVYDVPTGGLLQRTDDVDTTITPGAPADWTTPPGGGLNLVTDYEIDNRGRQTQELDPVHTVAIGGTATTLRTATWTVYDDPNHTTRIAQGDATGSGPDYTYTLTNPVEIHIRDLDDKPTDDILAIRSSTSGPLLPTDTFAQSTYLRWQTYQYLECCVLLSRRLYRLIPASGEGTSGVNFDETDFGYDVMKRRVLTVTPGLTSSFTVFDARDQPIQLSIGFDQLDYVVVATYVYDGGASGLDGNLTQLTQLVDDATSRVTNFSYDWRDRLTVTNGEIDFCEQLQYDSLDRVIEIDRYDTTIDGHLIGRQVVNHDDLSRVYRTLNYAVDPSTGDQGYALSDSTWYDPAGNVAKTQPSGAQLWTKTSYDGLNRPTVAYTGYGTDATYADIFLVADSVVMTQTELAFDADSNVIQTTRRERYHDAGAMETGALMNPGTAPYARVTYVAYYPDPIGRPQARADYGTNGSRLDSFQHDPGPVRHGAGLQPVLRRFRQPGGDGRPGGDRQPVRLRRGGPSFSRIHSDNIREAVFRMARCDFPLVSS